MPRRQSSVGVNRVSIIGEAHDDPPAMAGSDLMALRISERFKNSRSLRRRSTTGGMFAFSDPPSAAGTTAPTSCASSTTTASEGQRADDEPSTPVARTMLQYRALLASARARNAGSRGRAAQHVRDGTPPVARSSGAHRSQMTTRASQEGDDATETVASAVASLFERGDPQQVHSTHNRRELQGGVDEAVPQQRPGPLTEEQRLLAALVADEGRATGTGEGLVGGCKLCSLWQEHRRPPVPRAATDANARRPQTPSARGLAAAKAVVAQRGSVRPNSALRMAKVSGSTSATARSAAGAGRPSTPSFRRGPFAAGAPFGGVDGPISTATRSRRGSTKLIDDAASTTTNTTTTTDRHDDEDGDEPHTTEAHKNAGRMLRGAITGWTDVVHSHEQHHAKTKAARAPFLGRGREAFKAKTDQLRRLETRAASATRFWHKAAEFARGF